MAKTYTEVIFDVETQRFFDEIEERNPEKLGVSIVSLYLREVDTNLKELRGKIISFWEKEISNLWSHFQGADRIIGFNSLKFDVPVLNPYANFPLEKLPHFDIMAEFKKSAGRRISLNSLASASLGTKKIDHGGRAVQYWKKGDNQSLNKLKKYCEADVFLTRDIYDFGIQNQHLKYLDKWNSLRQTKVDFSYPKEENSNQQIGLF